ncbi:MAG: ABC transporter permease [Candidatus Hodarchaeales archaeon]|jgi:ABC-type multidrug transport system permease subunit
MKIQRIISLVEKDLKMKIRQPAALFMVFLFPLVLTGAFGLAFGSLGGSTDISYTVGVVDLDESNWSGYFRGNLSNSEVVSIVDFDDSESAQDELEQGNLDAYVTIPNNFAESIDSFWSNPTNSSNWINATIDLSVDQGSMITSVALPPLIQQILATTMYGEQTTIAQPVIIGLPSLVDAEQFTQFDLMAPGLFVFAVIFLVMIVAEVFSTERAEGLLQRIQVTPTSATEIVLSSLVSNMITAIIQVAIVFVIAGLMGFNPQTDFTGIIFAFVIVSMLALINVGFGLITATLAKSPGSATGISFLFILPQMFFGTFIPGIPQEVSQLVPSYYVTDSLTSVLLRGASIMSETVLFNFAITILISIIVVIAGIFVFTKFGKD